MDQNAPVVNLQTLLTDHLKGGQAETALILLKNSSKEQIQDQAWDIVPAVCEFLTIEKETENPGSVAAIGEILNHLASNTNVKELLLVLLEQADNFNDDVKFKVLLGPIQICLLNFPGKKASSIGVAMETLYSHLERLPFPDDQELEGKERMLLDLDENVQRIIDVVLSFVEFLKPIVDEVKWTTVVGQNDSAKKQSSRIAMDLVRYLMKVLNQPLVYLDLCLSETNDKEDLPKSTSRVCVESIVSLLSRLQSNFHQMVNFILNENSQVERKKKQTTKLRAESEELDELDHYDVEDIVPVLGLSVFSFLAFGERLHTENIPQVLTHQFIFHFNAPFVTLLLQRGENVIRFQGVSFLQGLLSRVPEGSFPVENLESSEMKDLISALVQVLTSAKVKELGQRAAKCLKQLLRRYEVAGRYQFTYQLISSTSHTGLVGYVIMLIKDEIAENLSRQIPEPSLIGSRLHRLLDVVFSLPGGEKSDLLEHSDRIMSALNLLRYLVLRDKCSENITGVWDLIPRIQDTYCELLRKGISLSRAHYQLELKKMKEDKSANSVPMGFSVDNCEMPEMSRDQQISVMETAIHTFDMMDSVLGRVNELINQQKNDK